MNAFKKLRQEKGMTQVELANFFSLDQTTVSKWELGKALPDTQMLVRLAKFFDVSTDFLLGISTFYYPDKVKANHNSSPTDELTTDERELLANFRKLNLLNKMHVSAYAKIRLEEQAEGKGGRIG